MLDVSCFIRAAPMSTLLRVYEDEFREQTHALTDEIAGLRATLSSSHAHSSTTHTVGNTEDSTNTNHTSTSPSVLANGKTASLSHYTHAAPLTGSGSRAQRVAAITMMMTQLRKLVTDMEYESNDVPSSLRNSVKDRIASYKTQLRSLDEAISAVRKEASVADRKDLIGSGGGGNSMRSGAMSVAGRSRVTEMQEMDVDTAAYRQSMRDNTAKIRGASNTLLKSEKLLNGTEQLGSEAMSALRTQTETMRHIHETTLVVDEEVTRARQIVRQMRRVMIKHKIILISIILVLILLIIVTIYTTIAKHRRMQPDTPHYIPINPTS